MDGVPKTVGRRSPPARLEPEEALRWQTTVATMFGTNEVCERGVFRFETFEEAQAWMLQQKVAIGLANRLQRTSSGS